MSVIMGDISATRPNVANQAFAQKIERNRSKRAICLARARWVTLRVCSFLELYYRLPVKKFISNHARIGQHTRARGSVIKRE